MSDDLRDCEKYTKDFLLPNFLPCVGCHGRTEAADVFGRVCCNAICAAQSFVLVTNPREGRKNSTRYMP